MYRNSDEMPDVEWDIRRAGRDWENSEVMERYELSPGKIELLDGKIFGTDEDRLVMLALLLENMGADAAVSLGSLDVWRQAVAAREQENAP